MPEKVKVPLSWALEQAGTLAQLWMRDNAPKPCTTEAFCDLFLNATFEIMGRMTGMSPQELMDAMKPDMDMVIQKIGGAVDV